MKYEITHAKGFKKAFKRLIPKDKELVLQILTRLANDEKLEPKYNDHALQGRLKDYRDCHIKPNLVLIYQKREDILELLALDIGSHSEVFKKGITH